MERRSFFSSFVGFLFCRNEKIPEYTYSWTCYYTTDPRLDDGLWNKRHGTIKVYLNGKRISPVTLAVSGNTGFVEHWNEDTGEGQILRGRVIVDVTEAVKAQEKHLENLRNDTRKFRTID